MLFGVFQKGIVTFFRLVYFVMLYTSSFYAFFLVFMVLLSGQPTGTTPKMITDGWHF